jgi:hypothetical protein
MQFPPEPDDQASINYRSFSFERRFRFGKNQVKAAAMAITWLLLPIATHCPN